MPFNEKIPTKHITLKCHFISLTVSGTRSKQLASSNPNDRAQKRFNCQKSIPPRRELLFKGVFFIFIF